MTPPRRLRLAAGLVAATSIAWLDPHQSVREANRLYSEGKYEEAAAGYNAALVDHPDSPELHFNLGDATFKQGKYDEAVAAYQKVETASDPARASRVAYNVGNATFRKGQALEQSEPQKALQLYGEALASYRRALGLAPDDADAKFNHEFVTRRIEEVKKRLEEQKQNQDQKPSQDQPQDQPPDQQQNQDQQQDQNQQQDQQRPEEEQQDQANDEQQQQQEQQEGGEQHQDEQHQDEPHQGQEEQPADDEAREQQPPAEQDQGESGEQQDAAQRAGDQQHPQRPPEGDVYADEKKDGELSKGEAAAILDSQRGEEVSPEDVIRKLQGARVAEPAQDW
ncbi:MAG: tetratricopeptide repeat protein [Deltaproteobacteria bacterium]|nr:tetratricopeptide repeat protein [Deltaproteobacteria bacterium]